MAKNPIPQKSTIPERLLNCPAKFITCMAWDAFGPAGINARQLARFRAFRVLAGSRDSAPTALLARWRWRLDIWKPAARQRFDAAMNQAFRARLKGWKGYKAFLMVSHAYKSNSGELGHG